MTTIASYLSLIMPLAGTAAILILLGWHFNCPLHASMEKTISSNLSSIGMDSAGRSYHNRARECYAPTNELRYRSLSCSGHSLD